MNSRKVTLYVRSEKRIKGTDSVEWQSVATPPSNPIPSIRPGGYHVSDYRSTSELKNVRYEFVLSEDQKDFVEMFEEAAARLGFAYKIIDVTKENIIQRELQKTIEKIRTYPTLVTSTGKRAEGIIPKEKVESFLLES